MEETAEAYSNSFYFKQSLAANFVILKVSGNKTLLGEICLRAPSFRKLKNVC